ncbi:MAG: class I tRNA ligase family protein [Candidatus Wildermuthbacteria bacterium]|nr:class I tRNA ligase family protein [Candidatus Wildermuthbacteria bacterium]
MEVNFPKLEERILKHWKAIRAFEKSVQMRRGSPRFVFYEGPPTANGAPGIHHVLSRAFKDIILRYKTMAGFYVERKAGWDTHGLPVELQIEKKLGLKSKKDIEKYGIAKFNAECKKSVWEYKKEWESLTERIGFWLDMEHPYITYETPYIETLWSIIKQYWQKGLLYKDYKVVPYCPRCGTSLSSHELAQGYKTVKEPSVYVKFKIRAEDFLKLPTTNHKLQTVYLLAWTTTPWTLPSNVALAVHPDISYVVAKLNNEHYIVAQERAKHVLGETYEIAETLRGSDLVGVSYVPLYQFEQSEKGKKVWEVVPADFVSTKEGTGIVHTAVAYGVDDFELGKKQNLAMFHFVTEEGKFHDKVKPFAGLFVKDADPLIMEDLKKRSTLFKEELYEHEYPFCWRCDTPLLYYAKESWFLNMQRVKDQLLANNEKIHWIPAYIKEGRFGEWLKEVRDWAFSRERYWGTPLPIWQCKGCVHQETIGSLDDLRKQKFSTNTYYILRHGDSERQKTNVMSSWPEKKPLPLTSRGVREIQARAKQLKKKKIDFIFSSDILRTQQTAEIIGKELGIAPIFDKRLREWDMGILNGKHIKEYGKMFGRKGETALEHYLRRFEEPVPKGESWKDVQKRLYGLLQELEKKYDGKTVLVIGHELPLTLLEGLAKGLSREEVIKFREKKALHTAELRKLSVTLLPYNDDMEVDLHRPHIDAVTFFCSQCGKQMERVKDVVDVWFDSGAMPFAQNPKFEIRNPKLAPPALYPADYIVEGIDQTRGWFYTLLAIATLLGFGTPFRNAISLGHILDEKGEKMSKTKGNVVSPWDMISKYGADAVRWYFYTMNHPGDPKLFSERDIQQTLRKFLFTLWNSFVFYQMYKPSSNAKIPVKIQTSHILDRWILSRLQLLIEEMTKRIDSYDVTGAARALEGFAIDDFSLWYIRRSRVRFQNPSSPREKQEALTTLQYTLAEVAKLAAPFVPMISEHIYQELQQKRSSSMQSVHWKDWPKSQRQFRNLPLEEEMNKAREVVAKALAERAKAGIKVRQPLALLKIRNPKSEVPNELLNVIKDEVNVKEVVFDKNLKAEVELDTRLTPALKEEGMLRDILRSIQDMRKTAGYKPRHSIVLSFAGDVFLGQLLLKNRMVLKRGVGIKKFIQGEKPKHVFDIEREFEMEGKRIWLGIKKA